MLRLNNLKNSSKLLTMIPKHVLFLLTLFLSFTNIAQESNNNVTFTTNLEKFKPLSKSKKALEEVEIIALGENTHGLGEVFKTKVELVKFLHQELGFTTVLFESGFGDAALAWEHKNTLDTKAFTQNFSSNFYYQSEELESLIAYSKQQDFSLKIGGFDCQPQQFYLQKRMEKLMHFIDQNVANNVAKQFAAFNTLYQLENDGKTNDFNKVRNQFIQFMGLYSSLLKANKKTLTSQGITLTEIQIIIDTLAQIKNTYGEIQIGQMLGWPIAANIRDAAMAQTVIAYKDAHPDEKIILWAQNSHIENKAKPNHNAIWMGHTLKEKYKNSYYSLGAIVYKGKNLNYNSTTTFEHNNPEFFAYHLNQVITSACWIDLKTISDPIFTTTLLKGMENNGNTSSFIAKNRFDGLLYIPESNVPKLLNK